MPRQVYFLVFLLIVLTALTLAHYFLYRKICKTFSPGKKARTTLLAVFAAFICSPLIIGAFSLYTIPYLSYFTSLTIYLWFAFLYYLFIFLFIIFIFNFISKKFTAAIYNQHHQAFLFIPALLSILIVLYGIFEAHQVQVETIKLPLNLITAKNFSSKSNKLKIVHISDLHLDLLSSEVYITSIVREVNRMQPDIIVSTGDLLDRGIRCEQKIINKLKQLKAPLGKFAIFGNHEFYSGTKYAAKITKDSGFHLLRNTHVSPAPGLIIVGFDDIQGQSMHPEFKIDEKKYLQQFKPEDFVIVLRHRPRSTEDKGLFDLQLSGHTHGGQIFPFGLLLKVKFDFTSGFHPLGKKAFINVNRGTGTWGPPVRFLTPPEITQIEFIR